MSVSAVSECELRASAVSECGPCVSAVSECELRASAVSNFIGSQNFKCQFMG